MKRYSIYSLTMRTYNLKAIGQLKYYGADIEKTEDKPVPYTGSRLPAVEVQVDIRHGDLQFGVITSSSGKYLNVGSYIVMNSGKQILRV